MSKLTFSTIPEVPLLLIFSKIALHDLLLNVNLVNRHWNTISAVASKHRKRLVLSLTFNTKRAFGLIMDSVFTDPFEVRECRTHYFGGEDDALIVTDAQQRFNGEWIERLVERLPNIATLEVNLRLLDISTNEHLATLINGWREHLVTLKLFTNYSGNPNQNLLDCLAQLTNLHTTINSLPVLQHFTYQLDFPFDKQNHDRIEPFTFPIACASLKELYFTSLDFPYHAFNTERTKQMFSNSFRNYVQSDEASGLRKVVCYIPRFFSLDDYLATSDVLSSKTTHIALDCGIIEETKLVDLSRKFYNLTHVKYNIQSNFPIDKLSSCLSNLENLKHITFRYIDGRCDKSFKQSWFDSNNNSVIGRVLPQIDQITPLARIKSVRLDLRKIRWHQYLAEELCFNLVFPNVELVYIDNSNYSCVHCGGYFSKEERETTRKSEYRNCIRRFLVPIVKCEKLKTIDYQNEDFAICFEKLDIFKRDLADRIE